jgi:nicotinate-nucleotide--dimethylbenzimidazole phosphoribosyltransferase
MMKLTLTGLKHLEIQSNNDGPEPVLSPGNAWMRVLCCAICRTDAKMWEQGHRDLVLPRVLGHEMVVADDRGRRYVVWPGHSCGICPYCQTGRENLCDNIQITGFDHDGGFADRIQVPEKSLIPLPDPISAICACFAEPLGCAIHALEKSQIEAGQTVLIYGGGTMGLLTALVVKDAGGVPLVIEKNAEKIKKGRPFFKKTDLVCVKETSRADFDLMINACPDDTAFGQGLTKVTNGGKIAFFSGLAKNKSIDTNLVNLLHYHELTLSGSYGLTRKNMRQALPVLERYQPELNLLTEAIAPPAQGPDLMTSVLSGQAYKYILDFSGEFADPVKDRVKNKVTEETMKTPNPSATILSQADPGALYRTTIDAISPVSEDLLAAATHKIDNKTKPLGALGRIEDLAVQMSLIQNTLDPGIQNKHLLVFAADHGITEEGVSAFPADVTTQMVANFLNGGAAINVLCRHHHIDMQVIDMGVSGDIAPHPDLTSKKVARRTKNFALQPAMTVDEMIQAIESGMTVFSEAYEKKPIDIIGLGEMGIGNTTSAAAIIVAITGISPEDACGRGTGVDDRGLKQKIEIVKKALTFHQPDPADAAEVLHKLGGFEIAGIVGAVLAAASRRTAVVLDGVISTAAGLIAWCINPDIRGYLIAGHKSVEPAQAAALETMGLKPLIDLGMRLGEGTGAALAIDIVEAACKIMTQMASFEDAQVSGPSE